MIHHHAPAFQDGEGIYTQSFIGCWVNVLAPHFEEIGLLLPETKNRTPVQDTLVNAPNIKFYPLPLGGKRWDYFQRKKQIRSVCQRVSPGYDMLLVRGITPRQWAVWQACQVQRKAFLLVGSILESRPALGTGISRVLSWVLGHVRLWEYKNICRDGILMANSPNLNKEIKLFSGRDAEFIPTNTLSQTQVQPLCLKEIGSPTQLLFCGRVVQDKGIEELILALGALSQGGSHAYKLRIVGNVQAAYRSSLEVRAKEHGVAKSISWEGFVTFGEKLFAFYREADFLVLPSYHEGFPHCIWEAGAFSLPVLCTKVGGIPGLVDESMVCFIEKKSAIDIAEKIIFLQHNDTERWKQVERLHQYVQKFSVEAAAVQLSEALTKHGNHHVA